MDNNMAEVVQHLTSVSADADDNWHGACSCGWTSLQVNLNRGEAAYIADCHKLFASRSDDKGSVQ